MRPALVVYGTPRFVHRQTGKGLYGPESKADLKAWRKFAEAAARRYSPNGDFFDATPGIDRLPVKDWIAWNEQNSKNNWVPKADPRGYGKLVKAFDKGISKVDPKAKIALGGMYGYPARPEVDEGREVPEEALQGQGHRQALRRRSTPIPTAPASATSRSRSSELRSVARKAGDGNVGVVVGELGWASSGPKRSESVVGKKGQANRLRDGLQLLIKKRNGWNVVGVYVYSWRDYPRRPARLQLVPVGGARDEEVEAEAGSPGRQEGDQEESLTAAPRRPAEASLLRLIRSGR